MADVPACRAALVRLGFSAAAALSVTDTSAISQIDQFRYMTDEEVEQLVKTIRRPGGTIANPAHNPAAVVAGVPATIANPGTTVNVISESNMKLMVYYIKHRDRTSRNTTWAEITLDEVRKMRLVKLEEESHQDPQEKPTIDHKDWNKTWDNFMDYINGFLGQTGVPLGYIVRDELNVKPSNDDPASNYDTVALEMIERAPIRGASADPNNADYYTPTFRVDNRRTWDLAKGVFENDVAYTYMKSSQRAKMGRDGVRGVKDHYLGPNNVDHQAMTAETELQNLTYNGETRRWNFQKYVQKHKALHIILEGLVEHGYMGIDPRTKVRHLNTGIRTNKLDVPKSQIMASSALSTNFDNAVTVYQDYITQCKTTGSVTFNISSTTSTKAGKNPSGKRGREDDDDVEVKDMYYPTKQYAKLSPKQRYKLRKLREGRGHQSKKNDKSDKSSMSISELSTCMTHVSDKLEALATVAAAQMEKESSSDDNNNDEEQRDDAPRGGNRKHAALIRRLRKKPGE